MAQEDTQHSLSERSLSEVVAEHPYNDFQPWWPMGEEFLTFMSNAICTEWAQIAPPSQALERVSRHLTHYLHTVYAQPVRETLFHSFINKQKLNTILSGEFDALSYAFYRSTFEHLAEVEYDEAYELPAARRAFTERVGKRFYQQLSKFLSLSLPDTLATGDDQALLRTSIDKIGAFLQDQGYLRDHFAFTFDVGTDVPMEIGGQTIEQSEEDLIEALEQNGVAYALYQMGYPAILPSAVYLYNTVGEAQHHSSRTIQDHFAAMGYAAHETDDFDPTIFKSDMVVELWEIRPAPKEPLRREDDELNELSESDL